MSSGEPTHHEVSPPPEAEGERLDLYVSQVLGLSRAKVKALFEEGAVRVEGRHAKKGEKVTAGKKVQVRLEAEAPALVADDGWTLSLLHEDAQLVAVDKPAGRPSHPLKPGEQGTVANALIVRFPECAGASAEAREGGLCHRLDIETSGVLLAARDRESWEAMRSAFTTRDVDKRYWTLVTGPLADEGEIDLPLRHHPRHSDRVEPALAGGDGSREAISRFRVLARKGEYALTEVQILTGVLHQVRAHLAAVGAPVVGDALYGGRAEPSLGRFFLHARSLAFTHPATKLRTLIESPLAPELRRVLLTRGLGS